MKPLISIMIATYNQPEYILRCVESSLNQDYENLEVIVSDDSTNNDVFKTLEPLFKNKKLRYYKNEVNLGRVKNYRKLLFELAQGEWAVMLDGDDYYLDYTFLSKAVSFISRDKSIVLVAAGHLVSNENNNTCKEEILVKENIIFDGKDVFQKKLKLGQHSANIYKRELAVSIDFYRIESMGADAEGLFRICLHGNVVYLKDIVVIWRLHGENYTFKASNALKQMREMIFIDYVYKYSLNFLLKRSANAWRKYMYKAMSYHIMYLAEKSGNYWAVLRVSMWASHFWGLSSTLRFLKSHTYKQLVRSKNNIIKAL